MWSVEAIDAFDLPGWQAKVAASGMRCVGLHMAGWGGADEVEVRDRARAIAKCVGYAEALGCTHITSAGAEKRGDPAALDRVIECVRQVLDQTSFDNPVKLTLEPHYGNVLEQREDFDRLMHELPDPRVGICVDTGHFHSAGVDTCALIRDHASRIYAIHLKDHIGSTSVGIGRGEIDLTGTLAALQSVGHQGGLTVELEVEDPENLPQYTQEAYVYLSGMLGQKL